MNLKLGTRLGPYEIVAPIGAGGMGEVYRGRDTRLGRTVAVKILPAEYAQDAKFKIRFEREAKAISALNHPHICTLYDIGDSYLVMEYCEGETLGDRIARGALPPEQVIEFGIQIAEALEKAHRSGIIHRDLKPANIMLTKSGVKLLDFGLAKQFSESSSTLARATAAGQIVGTLQYMAPEVLGGQGADVRSDIYALGLVLCEMTTTRRDGVDEISDAALARLVRACLAHDPDHRMQSAHDVAFALRWMRETTPAKQPRRVHGLWIAATAAVAIVAFVAGTRVIKQTPLRPKPVTRTEIDLRNAPPLALGRFVPPVGFFSTLLALSHDGKTLVYVGVSGGETQLFRRRLDSFEVTPVAGTRGAYHAFFSPDDRWIAFFANEEIMKVPADGGTPVPLAATVAAWRGVWTRRETLMVAEQQGRVVREIPENGGAGATIELPTGIGMVRFSDVLPDGTLILNLRRGASGDFTPVVLYDPRSHQVVPLFERGYDIRMYGEHQLVFARGGDLYVIGFDLRTRKASGQPVLLQNGVAMDSFFRQAQYAIADDGTIAFVPGSDRAVGRLTWVDVSGRAEVLPFPKRPYGVFSISPDGQKIATELAAVDDYISVLDTRGAVERRAPLPPQARFPVWMGDSKTVVYTLPDTMEASDMNGIRRVLIKGSFAIPSISADGHTVVASRRGSNRVPIAVIQLGSRPVMRSPQQGRGVCDISPDGKWVAYVSDKSGIEEIWTSPVADLDHPQQVSIGGGVEPRFCAACPDLFFRNGTRWYAVRRNANGEWTSPRLVFQTEFVDTIGRSYDLTPDGKRLLVSRPDPDVTDRLGVLQRAPGQ